jgi:hypothetical protein
MNMWDFEQQFGNRRNISLTGVQFGVVSLPLFRFQPINSAAQHQEIRTALMQTFCTAIGQCLLQPVQNIMCSVC